MTKIEDDERRLLAFLAETILRARAAALLVDLSDPREGLLQLASIGRTILEIQAVSEILKR